jgi:acyl-CoA dehydrogenase
MIGFELDDGQRRLREQARRFAREQIRPVAARYDEADATAWPVLEAAAREGLLTYRYPRQFGGGGVGSVLTACMVSEELGWGCAGIGNSLLGVDTAALPILLSGGEAQKARWLPGLCDQTRIRTGALALTEPDAGSDMAAVRTTAVRDGDDYVLDGHKWLITGAGIADVYIVFAHLDDAGITAFIVDADTPGLAAAKSGRKMGMRASQVGTVDLVGVRVPAANRLGD